MARWISYSELESIIGTDMARVLCRLRGGVVTYVPKNARPDGDLAPIIGMAALTSLVGEFGGEQIELARKHEEPYKGKVLDLLDKGCSHRDIALQVGVTDRYVRRLSSMIRRTTKQYSLWD